MVQWFRFYTADFRRLNYIARHTQQPKCLIAGVWTKLLSMANESPIQGNLCLENEWPLHIKEIAPVLELSFDETKEIFQWLKQLDIL